MYRTFEESLDVQRLRLGGQARFVPHPRSTPRALTHATEARDYKIVSGRRKRVMR
jgi:hypothetical protein